MEGAKAVANIAKKNFQQFGLNNIELIEGNFDSILIPTVRRLPSIDFAFIDGNHRKKPTIQYFNEILAKTTTHSILIFDDIHWSKEMEEAWEHITSHLAVRCSIDLFSLGIIFFRQEFKERQHFKIKF